MNRAEKRRQQKLADKAARSAGPGNTRPEQSLRLAMAHHQGGRLSQAEGLYRQILQADPDHPDALHLLGLLAHQAGNSDLAVELITKAIEVNPGHGEAHYNLGNVLLEQGKPDQAVSCYRQALAIKPDFVDALNNLGSTLQSLGRLEEAIACFEKSIAITPNQAAAHYNLGILFRGQGNLEEAATSYRRALSLDPEHSGASYNLCGLILEQGKIAEAVPMLQTLADKKPQNTEISRLLIETLNNHLPRVAATGSHTQAQRELLRLTPAPDTSEAIADETVRRLYRQCEAIVETHKLGPCDDMWQIYRGVTARQWEKSPHGDCERHMVVFDTFNVIPEYCFGCYKISIKPRNVVELFKLMLVFDGLDLKYDNTRKCFVEVRPEMSGAYKGLIYFQNKDEAEGCLKAVRHVVGERISKSVACTIQRGCSEFSQAFPEFSYRQEDVAPVAPMTYDEASRAQERDADENLVGHIVPLTNDSYNHTGITLQDALVMRSWLAYAAMIGDSSYQQISPSKVRKPEIDKRPPFEAVQD
ncbi:MAG: tetratricopeptide repeat protein [Rhodospirillales bacterium]|nr:tetratricopeptide repeat protein [Rhodospirillales bacterium]